MNLHECKVLLLVVTAVVALIVASPALQRVLFYPQTEFFSEMWLLGPGHMAEAFPHNVTSGQHYDVFLGISNHLGSAAYYSVQVKFRNLTQSAPDDSNRIASSLASLYSLNVFVADKESLEIPVNFAFDYSFQNVTRVVYTNITVSHGPEENDTIEQRAETITLLQAKFNGMKSNGENLNLQGYSSDWNPVRSEFFGNLVFELWIYNNSIGGFQYHERYVDLKLNMTR